MLPLAPRSLTGQLTCSECAHSALLHTTTWLPVCMCTCPEFIVYDVTRLHWSGTMCFQMKIYTSIICTVHAFGTLNSPFRLVRRFWLILHNGWDFVGALCPDQSESCGSGRDKNRIVVKVVVKTVCLHAQVVNSSLAEPVPEGYENVSDIVPPYNAFSAQGQPEVRIHASAPPTLTSRTLKVTWLSYKNR